MISISGSLTTNNNQMKDNSTRVALLCYRFFRKGTKILLPPTNILKWFNVSSLPSKFKYHTSCGVVLNRMCLASPRVN